MAFTVGPADRVDGIGEHAAARLAAVQPLGLYGYRE
jgi:hypothetical protein